MENVAEEKIICVACKQNEAERQLCEPCLELHYKRLADLIKEELELGLREQ
jgi:hypothetical protein